MNHNLLGSANEAHFLVDDAGRPHLDKVIRGESLAQVLVGAGYETPGLIEGMRQVVATTESQGKLGPEEGNAILDDYQATLEAYTYLED